MLSHFFGFRPSAAKGHATEGLGPVSYLCYGPPHRPVFHIDTFMFGKEVDGPPRKVLVRGTVIRADKAVKPEAY